MTLDPKALDAAHEAYAQTCGKLLEGNPMYNAIAAYLAATTPHGGANGDAGEYDEYDVASKVAAAVFAYEPVRLALTEEQASEFHGVVQGLVLKQAAKARDLYHQGYSARDGVVAACRARVEAAEASLAEAVRERDEALEHKVDAILYAQTLQQLRDTLLTVTDGIEDEGDRVYFGSTNDADSLKAIAEKIDGLHWDEIMASSQAKPDFYGDLRSLRSDLAAAESLATALQLRLDAVEGALREWLSAASVDKSIVRNQAFESDDLGWLIDRARTLLSPDTEGRP